MCRVWASRACQAFIGLGVAHTNHYRKLQSGATMADLSRLDPSLAAALDQARRTLARDGINLDDYVTSGYRTYGEQARLYAARGSNPNPVASPGSSPHEKGLAVDIPTDSLSSFL